MTSLCGIAGFGADIMPLKYLIVIPVLIEVILFVSGAALNAQKNQQVQLRAYDEAHLDELANKHPELIPKQN